MPETLQPTEAVIAHLESLNPWERLQWVQENIPLSRVFTTSSGGWQARVLPHALRTVFGEDAQQIPILFVDHHQYPPETLATIQAMQAQGYPIQVHSVHFGNHLVGEALRQAKREALQQAVQQLQPPPLLWLRNLRHTQSPKRAKLPVMELVNGLWRLYPFIDVSDEEIEQYGLPMNEQHDDPAKQVFNERGEVIDAKLECSIEQIWLR